MKHTHTGREDSVFVSDKNANRFLTTNIRSIIAYKSYNIIAYLRTFQVGEESSEVTFAITFMVREIWGLKYPIFLASISHWCGIGTEIGAESMWMFLYNLMAFCQK